MGEPVQIPFLVFFAVSSKLVKTYLHFFEINLFAKPRLKSDSCVTQGIFNLLPAKTTGKETYPPFEKITSGLISSKRFLASFIEANSLNGIEKVEKLIFLLNLTVFIP